MRPPRGPRTPPPPFHVIITMALADHMPIAYIRSRGYPPMLGRVVATGEMFDLWYERRYGTAPRIAEDIVVAAERRANLTTY